MADESEDESDIALKDLAETVLLDFDPSLKVTKSLDSCEISDQLIDNNLLYILILQKMSF